MSYRKHLMTSDEPPSELYKANEVGTNLAEVGTDLISRQSVLDAITASINQYGGRYTAEQLNMWGLFTQMIKEMPSAEPQRIRGRWIDKGVCTYVDNCRHLYKCDQCGGGWLDTPDFCPNCGSYNGGENEI